VHSGFRSHGGDIVIQLGRAPRRVLVVEDEALVAMMVQDLLQDGGYTVVGPASRVTAALRLAQSEALDAAVLDVNVSGEPIFPVADVLAGRGIPVVFLTGYGMSGLPEPYRRHAVIDKPIDAEKLAAAVAAALAAPLVNRP
jgi:CheY-like chemotaxis protein